MGSVPVHRRGVAAGFRATFYSIGFVLSFNIVILDLTLFLPYGLITQIISSDGAVNTLSGDVARFAGALDNVFIVLAVINIIALVPSLLRGSRAVADSARAEGTEHEPD